MVTGANIDRGRMQQNIVTKLKKELEIANGYIDWLEEQNEGLTSALSYEVGLNNRLQREFKNKCIECPQGRATYMDRWDDDYDRDSNA
jgi:hypothetical protein